MAYGVRFTLPERKLDHADVEFKVFRNGGRFGTLGISKGAVMWWSRNARKGSRMPWVEFERRISRSTPRGSR